MQRFLKTGEVLLLFILITGAKAGCATPPAPLYVLDVDEKRLIIDRDEGDFIPFSDPRLRCLDGEFGRECRYICTDADDLVLFLQPGL